MPMINLSQPLELLIALVLFVLMLWFSYQSKKSAVAGVMLFIYVASLALHAVEFSMGKLSYEGLQATLHSVVFDLVFILISFISYLWIDDIEAKLKKKKSIDNSLDWFWSKL